MEKVSEVTMVENFQNVTEDLNLQIEEAEKPQRNKKKKSISRHIILKVMTTETKN